jgi:hypothetical protein
MKNEVTDQKVYMDAMYVKRCSYCDTDLQEDDLIHICIDCGIEIVSSECRRGKGRCGSCKGEWEAFTPPLAQKHRETPKVIEQVIVDFLRDGINQVFGWDTWRKGKLVLTRRAFTKMQEYHLDTETLEDTFRQGVEVETGKIVQDYINYSVGMYYVRDEKYINFKNPAEKRYLIVTCWKGGHC